MITLTFYRYIPIIPPGNLETRFVELQHDQFGKDIKIACVQYRKIIYNTISFLDNKVDSDQYIKDFLDKHFGLVETIDNSDGSVRQHNNVPDYFQKFLSDGVLLQFVE